MTKNKPARAKRAARPSLARPSLPPATPMPSTTAQAEAAAARAVEQAGAQKLRSDRTHQLIGAMVSLVSGFAQGDDEMAVSALATVVGQVMAAHQSPPSVLAFVVRIATQTAAQIQAHEMARLQAQAKVEVAAPSAPAAA